ncbi:CDP-glucose 4,6-dehydratase [Candidatus Pelagibacter sp.]|nr:CDP-glucose 4,6-dehydratase [Candidatus Pelagibacter sp.]MDC0404632.1 CDP-glucose 4,6-dehydratase [Candidatus Pelagibacter sp.]
MDEITNFYKNKKVFVTGATGFKGSWLCSWLLHMGAKVYGSGYSPNQNKNLFYKLRLHKKIKLGIFDIRDQKKLEKFISRSKPSIIFHLAAQPLIIESYLKPHSTIDINIRGTLNILEASKKFNFVKSVVLITSDKCYENVGKLTRYKENDTLGGIDPYSASKSSSELIIRAYRESFFKNKKNCGISSARAGNVIGGGDWSANRLIPDCIRSLLDKKVIFLRNPNFNRPWQHVLEPLMGYLILAKKQFKEPKKYSDAWNFGTKNNSVKSVKEIVDYMIAFWGSGKIKVNRKNKFYEQKNLQLDINKAKKRLKWIPTYSVKRGVQITTEWYFQVYKNKKDPFEITNKQIMNYMNENIWH